MPYHSLCLCFFHRVHADLTPITTPTFERDLARHFRKQRIILTDAHIVSRMEMRPALTNQNTPRRHHRIGLRLYAKTLCGAVTAIARAVNRN